MSQPGKIPLHSKAHPISFSNSAKDFLSSPALAYLRGTFHQPPVFCTDWFIFLSCWLHLEKKVIFRTEKLCTGGSLPGYHRESLMHPTFLRAWLWTSSIKCPASIPDLLSQKLWGRDHMHERNEWFLAHPIRMSQKEKLNTREVGVGLGHRVLDPTKCLRESHGFLVILGLVIQLALLPPLLAAHLLAGSLIQLPSERRAGWEGRMNT